MLEEQRIKKIIIISYRFFQINLVLYFRGNSIVIGPHVFAVVSLSILLSLSTVHSTFLTSLLLAQQVYIWRAGLCWGGGGGRGLSETMTKMCGPLLILYIVVRFWKIKCRLEKPSGNKKHHTVYSCTACHINNTLYVVRCHYVCTLYRMKKVVGASVYRNAGGREGHSQSESLAPERPYF